MRLNRRPNSEIIARMIPNPDPRIVAADRLNGGLIITFDDGTCAVYSASLLHATLSQAEIVIETTEDE